MSDDAAVEGDARPSADVRELIRGLDPDQRRAVTSDAPLLAIIAGAGSGKTAVLTRRVARRCLDGSADPMHTAVITFTRQAASELRKRLRNLGLRETVLAGTFHALSLSLLQQHWERTGRRPPTVVQDRRRLIGEVLGPRRTTLVDDLAAEIDWARARNLSPKSYEAAVSSTGRESRATPGDVERVMVDLEALKRKRGVVDFDDLLSLVIDTAASDSEFASIVRWRLRHLFVDEAQDMNPLQHAVLEVFRGGRDDLTLVGDPSQSIYGFNGADPSILSSLERRFPGIEVVRLDTNYRCTPQIVRAGTATLARLGVPPPDLRSARPDGAPVSIYGFADETAEAHGVAQILQSLRSPLDSWSRFAVLARTNAQLPVIRTALEAASIPVRIDSGRLGDPLQRCLREVGEISSRSRLATWSRDVRTLERNEADRLSTLAVSARGDAVAESDEDRAAARRVANALDEFLAEGGSDGNSFLGWVRIHRPFDDVHTGSGVELTTFHAAKGREWDTVVLVGCEDGLVPHSSAKSAFASQEEIRLVYVAQTRAADRLVLTHARTRKGRSRRRSPLIDGIAGSEPASPPTRDFLEDLRTRRSTREEADPVLAELEGWRRHAARVSGADPLLICPDDVLCAIARRRPGSREDLEGVSGLGAPMIARAGDAIVAAVARGLSSHLDRDRDPSR